MTNRELLLFIIIWIIFFVYMQTSPSLSGRFLGTVYSVLLVFPIIIIAEIVTRIKKK